MPISNITVNEQKRHSRLRIGIPERTLLYRGFLRHRSAQDIRPVSIPADTTSVDAVKGNDVTYLAGNAYAMSGWRGAIVNVTRLDWMDAVISDTDLNTASHIGSVPMHRKQVDLPGIGSSSDVVPSGPYAHIRRIPTSVNWDDAQLHADLLALPPPSDPDLTIPVDRIISGLVTYPPNSGFGLIFSLDRDFWSTGTFIRLYFGGPTVTTPSGSDGGLFCLALSGSGAMWLYEHDQNQLTDDKWALRQSMKWSVPGRAEYIDALVVVHPYAWDRIAITSKVTEPLAPQILGKFGSAFPKPESLLNGVYQEDIATGHKHTKEMSGSGIVRLDLRRTARMPFSVIRLKYHTVGYLTDDVFDFERAYPAGTRVTIQIDGYFLPGTGISAIMYDANTNAPLAFDGVGFLTNAGQSRYYVKFTFTPSADRYSTPIFFGYFITVDPIFHDVARTPTIAGVTTKISITTEDEQGADHATGSIENADFLNQLVILRTQDRIRSDIVVLDDAAGVISYLGEFDTTKTRGKLRGSPFRSYPNPNWRDYSVKLVGMWGRLVEAQAAQLYNFAKDPNADVDPDTRAIPPWRVADACRVLFNDAGVPDDELDLPVGRSIRFWLPGSANAEEYLVQSGQPILPILEKLVHDYLIGVIVRDRNAGARGMWRHIPKPRQPWGNFLWSFRNQRPGGTAGKWQTHAGAWGANTSYIVKGTFDSWPEAPLANVIVVRGVRPGPVKDWLITATATNQDSIDNPGSIHFIDREIRYTRPVDPGITTKEHAQWLTALLYDELAFRRLWAQFIAPLPYVVDPFDPLQVRPRPLRVYDRVYVDGLPFLLTNVDIEVHPGHGAENQFGVYEGYFAWIT